MLLACEKSLIGKWQSDAGATNQFNRAHAKLEERQDRFIASLVGHMTLEFGKKKLHLRMPDTQVLVKDELKPFAGFEERKPYKMVLCNAHMASIKTTEPFSQEVSVTTYFFVNPDLIWVYGGTTSPQTPDLHIREYFRRVPK